MEDREMSLDSVHTLRLQVLQPRTFLGTLVMEHRAHEIHESAFHTFSNTILLRSVRHCELVMNAVFGNMCSKLVGQVLTTDICAQNLKPITIRGVL